MKSLVRRVGVVFLLAALFAPGAKAQEAASEGWEVEVAPEHDPAVHDHAEEGVVEVTPQMREGLGLTSELVCQGDLVVTLDLYGWVHPRPMDVTDLHASISGVIREVHVQPGDRVKEGSPLVTLVSPEFLDWQMELLATAHDRLALAEKNRLLQSEGSARVVQLLGDLKVAAAEKERIEQELNLLENAGSGSVALLEIRKKRGDLKSAEAQVVSNRALALAYGLSGDELDRLLSSSELSVPEGLLPPEIAREIRDSEARLEELETEGEVAMKKLRTLSVAEERLARLVSHDPSVLEETLTLVAERPGIVTELSVRPRSALEIGDEILKVVDYSVVHVETEVTEVDIASVLGRASDTIPIRIPGLANRELEGKVVYFDTSVHPDVRKAHLVLEVKNVEGEILRDNMAATVGIPLEIRKDAIYVPEDSVLSDGFERVVFLDEGEHFHRVVITPGVRTFDSIEVLGGLEPDQKVVVSGARVLLLAVNLPEGGGDPHAGHSH